jgi:methionyl-tRNA formyltransferase
VEVLRNADVDLVMLDRLMVILGKSYLDYYLGNTLNSHPAILPDLPGGTPTADAHARAMRGENSWTGNTAHFIDRGIDTGPPIVQRESIRITPEMSVEDVRRENYRSEGGNFWNAVVAYLSNPDAVELISLRREARQLNGEGESARKLARQKAMELVGKHREAFDAHWQRRGEEGLGTGRYQYRAPFGMRSPPVAVPARVQRPEKLGRVAVQQR